MTLRQAERERDKILADVNNQVFTSQSQIQWLAFVEIFDANQHRPIGRSDSVQLPPATQTHINPLFRGKRMCDIGPLEVQRSSIRSKAPEWRGPRAARFGRAVGRF